MTELESVAGISTASPVRALGRRGVLELLPRWPGEGLSANPGAPRTGGPLQPLPSRALRLAVATPAQELAARASAVELRRTIMAWRAVERELATAVVDDRDRARLQEEFDALRLTHHRLFLEVSQQNRHRRLDSALG